MSYTIDVDDNKRIVYVSYSATVNLDDRIQTVKNVCSSYADFMPLKILVNVCELEMDLSIQEQNSFGEFLANYPGLTNARVAVLHKSNHNPNLLIDIVAFNNGYKLAEFNDKKEAETWLAQI